MKSIFSFDDYRDYMRAFFLEKKDSAPGFSHATFLDVPTVALRITQNSLWMGRGS